ncbi:hypothetical protein ACFX1R_015810 [Malus domestica]
MEFVPPPGFNIQPGRLPLWINSAEWGFYGFKTTICALCCLKTHDILQCPKREYFPRFVQDHTNMINDSKRNWNNPYSEFYTLSLQNHLELSILSSLICRKSFQWRISSLNCWNQLSYT